MYIIYNNNKCNNNNVRNIKHNITPNTINIYSKNLQICFEINLAVSITLHSGVHWFWQTSAPITVTKASRLEYICVIISIFHLLSSELHERQTRCVSSSMFSSFNVLSRMSKWSNTALPQISRYIIITFSRSGRKLHIVLVYNKWRVVFGFLNCAWLLIPRQLKKYFWLFV